MELTRTIMVVEDEAIIALDLSVQLENLGYAVVATAHTGEDAIAKARSIKPDLVLMGNGT